MSNKNPYIRLINVMREQGSYYNPSSISIGKVTSAEPLTVSIGELQLNKDNLLLADYLLTGYKRTIDISNTNVTGETDSKAVGDHGSHSHAIRTFSLTDSDLTFKDTLKKDDLVAMVQVSDTNFLILCKVVKP